MAKHTPTPWCVEDPMGPDQLWLVEAGKQTYEWRCIAVVASDDPINDEDRDPVEPISMAEMKANAAFIVKAVNNHDKLVKALSESRAALIAFKDAVEASQKMNGREYVGLGIQINDAIGHAWNALADVGGAAK